MIRRPDGGRGGVRSHRTTSPTVKADEMDEDKYEWKHSYSITITSDEKMEESSGNDRVLPVLFFDKTSRKKTHRGDIRETNPNPGSKSRGHRKPISPMAAQNVRDSLGLFHQNSQF